MNDEAIPAVLTRALGDPLPEGDAVAWAALSPAQKLRATNRLTALERWHGDRKGWTVDDAANAASMGKNHFYSLAAKWEDVESRSLGVLGVQARAPRRRKSRHDKVLDRVRSLADQIVGKEPEEQADRPPVSSVMQEIEASWTKADGKLPGAATLRGVVTEARRRRDMKSRIGGDLGFDICALDIPDAGGQPHVAYFCVDRGTGYVHGFRIDSVADSVSGHELLAARILASYTESEGAKLPWVDRTRNVEIVLGEDRVEARAWETRLKSVVSKAGKAGPQKVHVQATHKPRRFGGYLRESVGTRIGRINLLPARTVLKPGAPPPTPMAGAGYSVAEAEMRVELEVADHNEAILGQLPGDAARIVVPAHVRAVFSMIATTK
ncbi:MAG: hypothetical protein GW854_07075 [Erythrobacter sp.]|nr:hypothetical protein [Erythrobacter sp.]